MEKLYLRHKLALITLPTDECLANPVSMDIRPKLQALIDFLAGEKPEGFTGLIFVKTRVEVAIICHILTVHPSTCKWRTSTFVGNSSFAGRKHGLYEIVDTKNQQQTLDQLRAGQVNIIVTTNALEEGIDVVSCNVVICYEQPPNIRSYIQRRGRARNPTSRYLILQSRDVDDGDKESAWRNLESIMQDLFSGEERKTTKMENVEQDDRFLQHEDSGYVSTLSFQSSLIVSTEQSSMLRTLSVICIIFAVL